MEDKFIFYDVDGERFKIRESEMSEFEKDFPTAKVNMSVDGENFPVGINERNEFLKDFEGSTVSYTNFDEPEPQDTKPALAATMYDSDSDKKDDKTTVWESAAKGLGSSLAGYGLDALNILSSNNKYIDPNATNPYRLMQLIKTGKGPEMIETPDYDTMMREQSDPAIKEATEMINLSERWGQEADPTGGKEGFVDLIFKGKIGKALQKGVAVTTQSLPTTISARHPMSLVLNMINMAGRNYAKETLENPDMPKWKRGIWAVGSAAWEQIVEKYVDPFETGGATAEVTEEFAKELLENGVKEAVENIAKKITKRLTKNVAEKSVGEGVEEVVTSIGQDVIGEGLDLIDGETDYGIRAQWEDYKEEHKDATKGDFALDKAKEYFDSFIGGALSGSYMSGPTQIAYEGAMAMQDNDARKKFDDAREYGSTMDYGNIYDSNDDVARATDAVADAMPKVSRDFLDNLSAEQVFTLSRNQNIPAEQRQALSALANEKAKQEGLNQKLNERLEGIVNANRILIDAVAEDGNIVEATHNGKAVYVKGAQVNNNGTVSLPNGNVGPVIVVDARTGAQQTVNTNEISSAVKRDALEYGNEVAKGIFSMDEQLRETARTTMSPRAKMREVSQYAGKKMNIDLGNGIIEVEVQQILPLSGEVQIKGKKGDLNGNAITRIGIDAFYDSITRDDNGNPMFVEGSEVVEEEPTPTDEPTNEPIELTGDEDFREYAGPILINGVPTEVEVQSQDDATDSVVYTYTDENGNTQRGTTTVRGFAESIQQAQNYQPAPALQPEPAPTNEPIDEPNPTPAPVDDVPETPQPIDWDALFEQSPEDYFAEMQKQFGDKTEKRLNALIAATQKKLDALNKANPQTDNEILENEEKKEKLEAKIATLNEMVARLNAPVAEAPVAPETPATEEPVGEAPSAPEIPQPEPVVDEPVEQNPPAAPQPEPEPAPAPETVEQTKPVAPNPVADPIKEAQKKEAELLYQLGRAGLSDATKQDLARRAGKAIGDMFATREEYEAYEETANDLGEYLPFFEGGVEESFAKRSNIESDSPVNDVPLTNEPKGENNGDTGQTEEGRPLDNRGGRTSNEGNQEGDSSDAKGKSERGNKGKGGESTKQVDKYPTRKGNATQKLLIDTFGFNSVTIPNTRKSTLNAIYDFMMEMSKMLGISPKSIGQGGWLSVSNLRSNSHYAAVHEMRSGRQTGKISDVSLKFKYDALTGIAHEWFHSLDYALEYFDSGVKRATASEIDKSQFSGREEVWDAIDNIVKAINKSGHPDRIKKLARNISTWSYWLSPKEMCARAFDEYILSKFREAGIQIEGTFDGKNNGNPTPEEMAAIAPAIDNLFKVLHEKEGKTPGTSVLYRIEGEEFTPTEMQQEVGMYVVKWLTDAGYKVHTDINELQEAISRSESEKTQFLRTDDGVIYGLVQNGEIYLDPALLNPNTPIHEYTHIWDMIIMEQNPQLWEEGKKLLKQLDLWNEIANSEQYNSLHGDEDLIASEVHSRLVGEKGEEVFTKLYERASGHANETGIELSLIIRIKNWIGQIMENIKSIILPYSSDKSVSLQEFVSMPLNDLVFNARPSNRYTENNNLYWGEQPEYALSNCATIAGININKFTSHAQQYYSELKNGIGLVVYYGKVYIFDIDSDGLARPVIELHSYEQARKRVDVFNRRNTSGHNRNLRAKRDRTGDGIYDNSSDGVRGTSENVSPVAEGESGREGGIEFGRENSISQDSVSGSSVESDGLLFRSSVDSEMEAIKNEAIANGTFMKAPNGQPTKLNERQWLQVRTQNFLNWFGDWINDPKNASKVVDENGEPLVVYHGSPYGAITEFNRKGHSVSGLREFGTYFGTNKNLAQLYAYARQQAKADVEKYELEKAKLDAIIWNNESPARWVLDAFDELDKLEESQKPKVYEVFLNIRKPKVFDAERSNGWDGWHKLKQDVGYDIKSGVEAIEAIAGHNSAARMNEQYDGIIAKNMADVHSDATEDLMGDVFLVFDETPANIKSATDNVGTFDSENPDIRHRRGEGNAKLVEQFEQKQNNERQELEYSDEFRRVQEESARMSEQEVSEYHGGQQRDGQSIRQRLGAVFQQELERRNQRRNDLQLSVVNESKGTTFDIIQNVDGRMFHDIFAIVRNYLPNGELVDLHDSYEDAICYITTDGLAGFAVTSDGNLISVFSLYGGSKRGFLGAIKDLVTEAGATHLDGYNSTYQPLAEIYSTAFGWKVASMMDYNMEYDHDNIAENHKMPQVAFMVNTDAEIETKHFDKDQYDEAEGYQKEQAEINAKITAQNAAVDYLAGSARNFAIENAVNEEAAKLGVTVTYKTREEMPKGHKNDKGYFNTKTGEIVICTENASSIADAIQTILHEAVAHKGLRQLMGDRFNEFINRVYNSLDAETKAKVDALATSNYNGNTAVAMEEYMASLAETTDFANNSVWDKIKSIFENIINAILGRNDIKIGDNELRYILRASYNNMVNPNSMSTIDGWAKDTNMRNELGINEATPELLSRTGIDPTEVSRETARATYERVVQDQYQEFQRQFQDAMQPVRIAIDAIQQETGNLPIEDHENFLLIQNQASSRSRVEIDNFTRRYYSPIVEAVDSIIDQILESRGYDKKDKKKRAEAYAEIRQYMIAKHGLERNLYYQSHNTRKLDATEKKREEKKAQNEYDAKVDAINNDATLTDAERELQLREALDEFNAAKLEIKTREVPDMRDYSGLTALFGLEPKKYKKAEEEAQILIDNFEAQFGTSAEELWKRINKATDKTLRHSYESGLLSRQQYNDIKAMFKFYIPLRGFDETTAEDVYSYARFEGNSFSPAVQSAKGRTSIADDPLAFIMNMAESEIAQGNKNRAKQALYNFILNRPVTDAEGNQRQNSLMRVESVWYEAVEDGDGNVTYRIATPDYAKGETYEEFEERMKALEEEDKAYKSKKGKVDVGMRFQKQQNRNAHYIYLKVNGVEKAIYINGDPKAAEAVNGANRKELGEFATKMRDLNRILSSTFTNYSLEFTVRNYFRDMIYSHINIDVKEADPAYRKKFRQNWRHNNLRSMMKLLRAYRAGELDGRALTEDEAAFVEFMNAGGQTGYTVINSVENHKRELERAIKNMQKGIEHGGVKDSAVFRATLGGIELLNECSELVTRFAAFKTSRDMGRSVTRAISDAKEITVNFNTRGAQDGKGWAGRAARYLGWSKFFFNASVQGVQNLKAMRDANKLKFATAVGGVMAFGFTMPIIVTAISALLNGDDDDDEAYWNIPEYDRQNNFCVPVGGGKYVKIPLPIGFREIYAIGDMVAAAMFNKKFTRDVQQVGMDMANKIASVILPVNPLESSVNGLNFWHTFLYTALPSSAQFAVQNATNIDWKGAPLQKEYTYNENDPQWMKAYSSNPDWMVGLSKWCNEHIGVGDMEGMDWSPEKLDNTLSNLFGGIYTIVKKTGKTFSMVWNEENRTLSNVPLVGVALGSGMDDDERFITDAFYDEKEYYDNRVGFIKRRAEKFGLTLNDVFVDEKGKHHPKMMEVYNNKEFDFMQEWYKGNKTLESLDNKIKRLEKKETLTSDEAQKLVTYKAEYETKRREFVLDMLELD